VVKGALSDLRRGGRDWVLIAMMALGIIVCGALLTATDADVRVVASLLVTSALVGLLLFVGKPDPRCRLVGFLVLSLYPSALLDAGVNTHFGLVAYGITWATFVFTITDWRVYGLLSAVMVVAEHFSRSPAVPTPEMRFCFALIGVSGGLGIAAYHGMRAQRDTAVRRGDEAEAQVLILQRELKSTQDVMHVLARRSADEKAKSTIRSEAIAKQAGHLAVARQQAVTALQAKGDFLAKVSHEMRTPLAAVLGMLRLVDKTDPTREQREYLRLMEGSLESLRAMLDDLLELARLDARKVTLDRAAFGLSDLVDDAVQLFAPAVRQRGLAFDCFIAPDIPRACVGDAFRLRQILVNLLSNALKFTHEGGITVRAVWSRISPNRGEFRLEVADTGVGIPEHRVSAIFDAFEQVEGSTARQYGGSGLGLAIVRQIVDLMDGQINVQSDPGHGSKFTIVVELPIVELAARARCETGPWYIAVPSGTSRDMMTEFARWHAIDLTERIEEAHIRIVVADGDSAWRVDSPSHPALECLTLPLSAASLRTLMMPSAASRVSKSSAAVCLRAKCLVVDDNEINRMVLERTLTSHGAKTTVVGSGHAALCQCEVEGFDIVLMDCHMPGLDGFETAARLRHAGYTGLIIAVTAGHEEVDRTRARDSGMDGFITKPLRAEDLLPYLASAKGRAA
jgi:signal transduction histidine kinase/CheY-like chemotaxis protein